MSKFEFLGVQFYFKFLGRRVQVIMGSNLTIIKDVRGDDPDFFFFFAKEEDFIKRKREEYIIERS